MSQKNWIFPLEAPLQDEQITQLNTHLGEGLAEWKAHGHPIHSILSVKHRQFIWIMALNDPSGCSIDWLRNAVEHAVERVGAKLADSSRIFFFRNHHIESVPFQELETALANGTLTPDTTVLDNTVVHTGELEAWEVPLQQTWMQRYLN